MNEEEKFRANFRIEKSTWILFLNKCKLARTSASTQLRKFVNGFLEGEAYVFAAVAGTVVGVSWVKPRWVYDGNLGRIEALKKAFTECLKLYVFIVVLLLIAAIIETVTIILFMQ